MGRVLKALIVTACLVVIAAGGQYLWSTYRESIARQRLDTAAQQAATNRTMQHSARLACLPFMTAELGQAKRRRDQCRSSGAVTYSEQLDAEAGKGFTP